jgi:CheY-like chemotaxis protein/signal transduction histidine kinase
MIFMVATTAIAIGEIYIQGSKDILVKEAVVNLEHETDFFSYPLEGVISQLKADARLLANLQGPNLLARALQNDADSAHLKKISEAKVTVNIAFTEMLATRDRYIKIQFIDAVHGGREMLRVERSGEKIQRVPDSALSEVTEERYFQEGLRINPGDAYLSSPRLLKEKGKLIEPHMLVINAAVPVYTAEKNISGMIVISMDLNRVLQKMRRSLQQNRTLYVVNSAGDYLIHPDSSKLYGADLGRNERIQKDQPRLPGLMTAENRDRATFLPATKKGNVFTFNKYRYDSSRPENYLGIALEAPYRDTVSKMENVQRRGLFFAFGVTLAAVTAALLFLRILISPLNQIADSIVRYRKGEKDIVLPEQSPDEIGVLAREFRDMMNQKNEEDWVKESLITASQSALGFRNLHDFAGAMIQTIALAVNAQVGVLYISGNFGQASGRHEAETFFLLGACGYTEREDLPQSFHLGEGLVGQCAKDRRMRVISDIPDDYLRVASALGEAKPRAMVLIPVLFENTLAGVLELASLGEFTPAQCSFLEQISFNLGVIISSISARMKTEELLEEARQTAEELQRNEEELKTQQEELEVSNEEMEEKTRALEEQNAQIRQQSRALKDSQRMLEDKARELELSSKYKSEFLANMSHELRTPLNSLLILARSLAGNEEGNLTPEQVEEAQIIHNGGLELLGLINDILDLSKVEAGKLDIIPEDTPLSGIVKRLVRQFDPVAKERGVAFNIRIAEGLPETICTDAQRAEQILKNLLSNAFKFTEAGSVTLELSRPDMHIPLQRSLPGHDRMIAFRVTDTGIGIEQSKLDDIFEAFQQEDGSTDRHYGGTGLGLTIARKFAYMLGGEIQLSSKKGEGSSFSLLLPVTWAATGAGVSTESEIPGKQKAGGQLKSLPKERSTAFISDDRESIGENDKVLLLIEDDRDFAHALMKIARKRGYKCLAAGDGKTGILLASEYKASAILLDIKLPDMDGLGVLDQLKHNLKTRHIPVHIVTGNGGANVLPMRKGAIGYLTKPVSEEDINNAFLKIEKLLQSEIKRILVVEDDKKTQSAIRNLLKKKDVEIACIGMGASALAKIKTEKFDCIILDLSLPDMTGFDWLECMERETGDAEPPPVIIYTAKDLSEEENRKLNYYTGSIVIKGASSSERLLDEVTLFLHSVESMLTKDQQAMIRMRHDPDRILQDRTILLVDDDMRNIFALSRLLKKHGMNVIIADNGQMALEKLEEEKNIELVVMDIMMPVMDGYQAMRAIRARKEISGLPIIALTARAMPEEQKRCIEAGANDYMTKPVDVDHLLMLIRVWLFRHEAVA